MPLELPCDVLITPETSHYYEGLSHQDLPFHFAIAELIDNSLSAYSESENKIVEVTLEKNDEKLFISVGDQAKGISLNQLRNKILRMGGQGESKGPMNEHGYGLKNALCVLTQNKSSWKIITRDCELSSQNKFVKVEGPFKEDLKAQEATLAEWEENATHLDGDTGTRIHLETSFFVFSQIYKRSWRNFDNLIQRLIEHFGVIYRGYLEDRRNNIYIRYKDSSPGVQASWKEQIIAPIKIEDLCAECTTRDLSITFGGETYSFKYTYGKLNKEKVNSSAKGLPFPLKIYYQNNLKTQGVDIRVNGKVIMLHQLDYIWQDIERHNSLNSFIGEIVVDNKNFKTINNKTQLSPQDAKWDLIREKLAEEEYKPSKSVISRTEDGIRDTLKNQLENNNPGSNVDIQYATWDGAGVLIDIHMKKNDGKVWIYELKKDSAGPLDVYQLIMYWDGKVKAGESPEQAFLVASDCPTSVKIMIDYWNTRKDASNSLYKLIFKKIDDLMPPR